MLHVHVLHIVWDFTHACAADGVIVNACVACGGFRLIGLPSPTQNAASATICAGGSNGVGERVSGKATSVQDTSLTLLLCICLDCMALWFLSLEREKECDEERVKEE